MFNIFDQFENKLSNYQLRVGGSLRDVGVLGVDVGEVGVDGQREERVPISPHQMHLDRVADLELLPGHGHDAERKV